MKVVCERCGYNRGKITVPVDIVVRITHGPDGVQKVEYVGIEDNRQITRALLSGNPELITCARCGGPMRVIVNEYSALDRIEKMEEKLPEVISLLENIK